MASYGINIKNSDGDILVDGENINPYLYEEISFTTDPSDHFRYYGNPISLSNPTSDRIFATIVSNNSMASIVGYTKNTSGEYNGIMLIHADDTAQSIKIRVYSIQGSILPSPPTDYGIDIFNSSGKLVYTSKYKTVKTIKTGTIQFDLNDASNPEDGNSIDITFSETSFKPEIHLGRVDYVFEKPSGAISYDLYMVVAGNYQKNSNDKYYKVTMAVKYVFTISSSGILPAVQIDFPWYVPYVIFI